MDFDKIFIIVLTIECIFLVCLFIFVGNRLMASERDRADAEKWRNGQKPIGRLIAIEEDGKGLKITGQLFEGTHGIEASIGPMSIGPPVAQVDWWNRKPPEGKRWITPMECHGNEAFCSTCSPRNVGRPIRDKEPT